MAKHKLVDEEEDTVPKVSVIGISCHVPDYRLCWALNLALGLGLERRRTDIVEHARGKDLHYPVFQQVGAEGMTTWSLICNLCGKRRLIADQKQADYFLVIDQDLRSGVAWEQDPVAFADLMRHLSLIHI